MRCLILFLALLVAVPYAWGGMAARRMLRMDSEIGYNVSTFEGGSDNGWVGNTAGSGSTALDGLQPHVGSYSYLLSVGQGGAGTGYASITKTFTCAPGDLTFWSLRDNTYSSGRVLIDGAPVWAYTGTESGTWTKVTITISTAGSHEVKIEIPNTSLPVKWGVDDISVPVP